MSNTEKKLDALIEALGFDVETINKTYINGREVGDETPTGIIEFSPHDLIVHTTDYKLTKRVDLDLINAMDRCIELMLCEFSHVEPKILKAFKNAGWVRK